MGGTTFKIEGPTELTSKIPVPVDKAEAWSVTSTVLNASLVIVAIDTQLVVFSFVRRSVGGRLAVARPARR